MNKPSAVEKKKAELPVEAKQSQKSMKYKTGLWIGLLSAMFSLILFTSGSLVSFDTYLTALVFQNGFKTPDSRSEILIVKKDQATAELLKKNPDRAEFASIFNFLGQTQHIKLGDRNRITTVPIFTFEVGLFKKQRSYPFMTSFSSWNNDMAELKKLRSQPDFKGFVSLVRIREKFWPKKGATKELRGGVNVLKLLSASSTPLLLPTILTDWKKQTDDYITVFFDRWTNVFANIISSQMTVKMKFYSNKSSLFKFTIYLRKEPLIKEYYVPPASVIAFDFILQGKKDKSGDNALVKALDECDSNVILAQHTKKEEIFKVAQKKYMLASATQIDSNSIEGYKKKDLDLYKMQKVEIVTRKIAPHKAFIAKSVKLAMIDMSVGNKSYVTEAPLFIADNTHKKLEPSFSLMTAMSYLDRKHGLEGKSDGYVMEMNRFLEEAYPKVASGTFQGPIKVRNMVIPVNSYGRMLIDFVGSTRKGRRKKVAFPSASFFECFNDERLLALIASDTNTQQKRKMLLPKKAHIRTLSYGSHKGGKICLIGPFEISDFDYFPTPLSLASPMQIDDEPMMGIEIHANAIANILEGRALTHPKLWKTAIMLVVLTLLLGALLDLTSPIMGVVLVGMFFVGTLWLGDYSYHKLREVFHFGALLISFSLTWLMSTLVNYIRQRSQAKATKQMFSKFVAADVVQYMLEHPELVKPGGEKVELTIFFSDVAGFTSISEALSPENLVILLNEYLGAMTDILFEYGGTLDKFIGDAVMAFWNHPKKQEDHALRGCLCALAMQDKITELQKDWAKRGLPRVAARAGLNSAEVVVGYMGSDRAQMNFTCMGDGVNLAARLEGANKEYGTLMMMGDATYQQVKHRITGRFLDFLAVKGKKEPVKVVELVSEKGKEPPEWDELIELYDNAMQLHLDRKWEEAIETFEKLLARWPDDGPSKTYIKRCHEYMENPPPEKWDGRYILTHK